MKQSISSLSPHRLFYTHLGEFSKISCEGHYFLQIIEINMDCEFIIFQVSF